MRKVVIAMSLIEQGGNYLLQLRAGDPKIGAVGLIGCYGGQIEDGEQPLQTVCRELAEETTLTPALEDFEEVGLIRVISDHNLEPVKIKAHLFRIAISEDVRIGSNDGVLVSFTMNEAGQRLNEMTPATRAAFEEYVLGE